MSMANEKDDTHHQNWTFFSGMTRGRCQFGCRKMCFKSHDYKKVSSFKKPHLETMNLIWYKFLQGTIFTPAPLQQHVYHFKLFTTAPLENANILRAAVSILMKQLSGNQSQSFHSAQNSMRLPHSNLCLGNAKIETSWETNFSMDAHILSGIWTSMS